MTRVALRISASSVARVPLARFAPCVLELLGHARPQAHAAMRSVIRLSVPRIAPVHPVISVRGLRKTYDGVEAVAGIDLEVERGEIFAFLGPNGAGKTTTVEILEGYRIRSAGEVAVLGADPASAHR